MVCNTFALTVFLMLGFKPIEVNILEYEEVKGSNIASHFDDFWIWGERILGVNLLSDTVMKYTRPDGDSRVIEVPIPRRSLYLMSASSRFVWQHGIDEADIHGRRLVVTLRELTPEFLDFEKQPIGQELTEIANNFI